MMQETDVGNKQLKLTSTPVLHTSFSVRDVKCVSHIFRVTSDQVWVSDGENLILADTKGDTVHRVTDITTCYRGGIHTVNSSGELIYIDRNGNINKLSIDSKTVTTLLESPTSLWRPCCVYCSPSTGDLMVGVSNICLLTGKITRYKGTGQHILTIQHDNEDHTLYSLPNYITENTNGDIIVSDVFRGAIVVTERGGRHRFSYKGPPSGSSLLPRGICTDALSHILVCEFNTHTVQMIDKDGHFLSLLKTKHHGIYTPCSLNYDEKNHLLWVGSEYKNTVSVYRYIQRRYSLTDDSVDNDEKFTDKEKIVEHTSKNPGSKFLALPGRRKKINISASTLDDSDSDDEISIFTDAQKIRNDTSKPLISFRSTFPRIGMRDTNPIFTLPKPVNRAGAQSRGDSGFETDLDVIENEEPYTLVISDGLLILDSGTSICLEDISMSIDTYGRGKFKMTEKLTTFSKILKQLSENDEADIRMSFLVGSLDLEIKPSQLSKPQIKSKDYVEVLHHLDYLDCEGLNLVDEGREDMTRKSSFQFIEEFSGYRVHEFLEWMENCKAFFRKTRYTKWGSISSVLHNVYTIESIFKFEPTVHPNIVDHSIRCAIESENCLLVSELVHKYLFDRDIQLHRIFEDIKRISPAIIDTIIQTVRSLIQRKFRNLQNNGIVLSLCWDCGEGNRLVMVMSYRGKIEMSDRIPHEVLGFKLVLYNFTQPSEASSVFQSVPVSKKMPLPTVTEGEARKLFRKHSNLTMISASPYKSMGYSKGKHRVVEKTCINLFCFHKGYIPYGEEIFPKLLGEFEVDVQEGYSVLGGGASLEIGGYICRAGCGSIGGFVDLPGNKTGLITCAHVIFSSQELEELESINRVPPGIEVKAFDRTAHTYRVCGTCTAAEFPKCFQQATSPRPNVDAALIELDRAIDTFSLRTVSSDQLYSAGFDPHNPPDFSGDAVPLSDPHPVHRICERIPDKLDSVIKYGVETGLTIGHLYHSGVHVRFVSDSLKLPDNSRSAIMCDQIEIQNFPQGQFFECGDSGSFVFCINPDKTLSCLGMAVGLSLPQKSCLVTPIDRILRTVCPGARLKPCSSLTQQTNAPPQATLDMILSAIGNFQASLQSVQTSLQSVQTNFQTSLKSVETNFQASLQNVERNVEKNFQASLQNVERNVEKNFQASLQNVERNVEKNFQASLQNTETNFQAALKNVERNVEKNFQTSLENTEKNFEASLLNLQTEVRTLKSQAEQTEDSKTQSQ